MIPRNNSISQTRTKRTVSSPPYSAYSFSKVLEPYRICKKYSVGFGHCLQHWIRVLILVFEGWLFRWQRGGSPKNPYRLSCYRRSREGLF